MRTFSSKEKQGFIALMATIVISAMLLVMAVENGIAGYHARFNILGTEAKEQATSLAQGCADQALSAIVSNPSYVGGTDTNTEAGACHVFPIQFNTPAAGIVTIQTQAEVRGSFANLEMQMDMNDIHIDTIPAAPTKGTIVVITNVVNDGNGTALAKDFVMHVTGTNPSTTTFNGVEGGVPVTVDAGAYSVTENPLTGYSTSISTNCSGTIAAGDLKFCTISNNDITTTLTVLVNVVNDNGGTNTFANFPITLDGVPFSVNNRITVSAGPHTLAMAPVSGYSASAWGYQCASGGAVTVNTGEDKTCIINVNDNPPPAPSCADSVMILDRTGSMSNTDLSNESVAANAMVNLYAGVQPPALPPRLGAGSIGAYPNQSLPSGAAGIPTLGQLSTAYANLTSIITQMTSSNSSVGSDLSAGINAASAELSSARHVATNKKVMIMVSDGDPNQPTGNVSASTTLSALSETTGTSTAWSSNTGTKVTAISANDADATYITLTGGTTQTFTLAGANIPANASNISVTLHAVARRASGTTASINLVADNGTTLSADSGHILSTTYTDYTWQMNTNPFGGAWTPSMVNNWPISFGVQNTSSVGNIPRTTQIYAVVSYTTTSTTSVLKSPTSAYTPNQWTNPTRVSASDNQYATDATSGHQQGLGGFGFAIPAGATISGVQVVTEAKLSGTANTIITPTLYPTTQGSQAAWTNGSTVIDETGTPNCSSADSIITGVTNARESATMDISTIPDGSTITGVTITSYDKADTVANGTYKTFVRINSINSDAGTTLTSATTGGSTLCNAGKTQTIAVSAVKSVGTSLEIGVYKVSGNTNAVRVGALNATITYTPPTTGTLGVALSANNGTSWTASKSVTLSTTEATATPSGNSTSDLWGRAWVPNDFNNGNFLLRIQNNAYDGITTSLDYATVEVFYTGTTTGTSAFLAPVTTGSQNGWQANTGSAVSATAANDSDTTYISNTPTALGANTFLFPNSVIPATANNISVVLHAVAEETNGTTGNIKLVAEKSSGAQITDAGHALTSTYADYSWNMATNPFGGAWTVAEVNAWTTFFGVKDASTGGTLPRVTRLYLLVNYTVATDPVQAALNAADAAKLGPDGIAGTADDTDIFTIHFGSDPGPYNGKKLLANLASGNTSVSGHQNGSFADASSTVTGDTGFLPPTSATGTNQFTSPLNALVSDNAYATDTVNGHTQGYANFGLTVPPTASVTGIAVDIEAKSSDSAGCQVGAEISWDNGATFTTTNLVANITGSDVVYTLGGAGNLWGRTWSLAEMNNGKFVVRLKDIDPGAACINNSTLSIDRVRARAYYSSDIENSDGDNFFVSPTAADMKDIFTYIGQQVCPAAGFVNSAAPPTQGTISVVTQVINNNGGSATVGGTTMRVTATSPSQTSFAGSGTGVAVTMNPGSYSISGDSITGYAVIPSASCDSNNAGTIVAGEARVCVITYDDIPPPPPPPNYTINLGSWTEVPTATP